MTIQANIETKINDALEPEYLEVANESHMPKHPYTRRVARKKW
jgi:stress-induced morphogen